MADLLLPRLRPDQWAIAEHPAKVKTIAAGRRWGKTTLCGDVALAASSQGAKVAWVAPTYRNSRPLWRWAEAAVGPLTRAGGGGLAAPATLHRTERAITFPHTGGFLGLYSADNDTGIRGEWFHLVIVDEAARVFEETWEEVLWPTLADADGDAILVSTPAGKNWFWEQWQRGLLQMDGAGASWTAPSSANPNPRIQRAAALARERVPDRVYRQEWLAEFVSGAQDVWDLGWFDRCRFDPQATAPRNEAVARWISWDTGFLDTGDAAYSAAVVAELTPDYRLFIREVWRDRVTFPTLVAQIRALAERYGQDRVRSGGGLGQRRLRAVVIEDKASGISATQTLKETSEPWLAALIQPFQPHGSKAQRAELAAVWCREGCVWLPAPDASVPWLAAFEDELRSFPSGAHKDQVDCFSQLILFVSRYLALGRDARARAAAQLTAA